MVIFTDLHCIVVTIVCAGQFSRWICKIAI
jgi:hypothetical protein